jgi:hypothetical protein
MRPTASFVIALLEQHEVRVDPSFRDIVGTLDWPAFADAVAALQQSALAAASRPGGLATTLEGHAESELSGAEVIKFVGDKAGQSGVRELLSRHAADEKRHSRIFHALSRLVDPGRAGKELYPIAGRDPFLDEYDGDLNGFLCDTHFAEIRNLFYLTFLRENISHADSKVRRKVRSGLARVISDEKMHIVGTGFLINKNYPSDIHMSDRIHCAFDRYVTFIEESSH